MSDKMREEFEEWAVTSAWLGIGDESQMHQDSDGTGYNEIEVHTAWLGWKASRESMVIELPRDVDQFADDDPGRRAFSLHTNTAYRECRKAIEAAGLKVKP